MAHQVPAHYDEEDCLFIPPSRSLGFNPQLRLNDSLLAQSYIEAYDISYPEAMRRIEAEVEEIREHLHNDGTYTLNDLGTLTINADGNYEFIPCEAGILSPSLYGLGATSMQKLSDKRIMPDFEAQSALPVQLAEEGVAASVPLHSENVADSQEPVGADSQEPVGADSAEATEASELIDFDDDDSNTVRLKWSWIRNTVAAVAAAILFFFIATPVVNSNLESATISHIGNKVLYKIFPQDTNFMPANLVAENAAPAVKAEKPVQQPAAQPAAPVPQQPVAPVKQPEASVLKEAPVVQSTCYTIVLASQVKKSNAEIFVEQLHQDGHKDAHIYIHKNIVRVVCGSYPTEREAYQALQSFTRIEGLEDAWVFKMQS